MKLSFIIPAHNAAETIERTVSSIEKLNLSPEILIIENGSTDDTLRIAEKCASRNCAIRVLQSETGVSRARNAGIKEATGNWIVFADADDEYLEGLHTLLDKVQTQSVAEAEKQRQQTDRADVIIGSYMKDNDSIIHDYKLLNTVVGASDEVKAWLISKPTLRMQAWAKVYRKDFLIENQLFFNEDLSYSEDSEFVIRTLIKAQYVLISDIPVYKYHSGTISTMRSFVEGRTEKYIKALEVAESDVEEEREKVKQAFLDYTIAHINIIGVHDIFACEIKETWKNRCKKMNNLMKEGVLERTLLDMSFSANLQSLPVILCKHHLTAAGGIIYYVRSLQNRKRYRRAHIDFKSCPSS